MTRLIFAVPAGFFGYARAYPVKAGVLALLFIVLTAFTQIGGVALLLCLPLLAWTGRRIGKDRRLLRAAAFLCILAAGYLGISLAATPLAGEFGRFPLPCGLWGESSLQPRTILTCLLSRHFTTLPARQALQQVNSEYSRQFPGSRLLYLDAGFPFFDWFPMFPHLSHRDGRKVDLAFPYAGGAASPSPIGYWGFEQPRPGDALPCKGQAGWLRWDMAWLQPLLPHRSLDRERMRVLLAQLAALPAVRRIFIEPHLRARLDLHQAKLRFQGCAAARHDDHIHVEFR